MTRTAKPSAPKRVRAARAPIELSPLAPLHRRLLVALAALLAVLVVSFRLYDPDLWQHLRVGRALWEGLGFPHVNVWTWPTLGAPDVVPSWLFRALLWPFWKLGGVDGIYAWRALTTLAAFGMLLAAARAGHPPGRAASPSGGAALLALLWCVLLYRYRSQARPETLVAVILAAQLWALESWRARGGGRWWIAAPALAMLWANAHISYTIGLWVTGAYLLDALARRARRVPGPPPREAWLALGLSVAASFLNPYGHRILAQPFEYFFVWRHEPIFRIIGELGPPDWSVYAPVLLPALLALMAGLPLLRLRAGADVVQLAILGLLVTQSLSSQRFLGYLAVAAAPFFARDLTWAAGAVRAWPALARPGARAIASGVALALLSLPALVTPPLDPGHGVRWNMLPREASDWIEKNGVRGRAFNMFQQGGYLLWRFWPDSTRLPFMDIHQTGTRADRLAYVTSLAAAPGAWAELDRRHRFDWVLLSRVGHERVPLLDQIDADSAQWALVFLDDAAALFLRRGGANAALAESARYRIVPAGAGRLSEVGARVYADPAYRRAAVAELERAVAGSPWNATSLSALVNVALSEERWDDAMALLDRAASVAPDLARLEERRGLIHLMRGLPAEALKAFERERRIDPSWPAADLRRAQALQAMGRLLEARDAYERASRVPATSLEAADSLESLGRLPR